MAIQHFGHISWRWQISNTSLHTFPNSKQPSPPRTRLMPYDYSKTGRETVTAKLPAVITVVKKSTNHAILASLAIYELNPVKLVHQVRNQNGRLTYQPCVRQELKSLTDHPLNPPKFWVENRLRRKSYRRQHESASSICQRSRMGHVTIIEK